MSTLVSLFFISMIALAAVLNIPAQESQVSQARADVAATSALAYRASVVNYLNSNPTFSGTVPDSSLTPLWGYQRDLRWTNTVVAGALYVYDTAPTPNVPVLDLIYKKTLKSFMVGRNQSGVLVSAKGFSTGITVPVAVPNGAILIFGK